MFTLNILRLFCIDSDFLARTSTSTLNVPTNWKISVIGFAFQFLIFYLRSPDNTVSIAKTCVDFGPTSSSSFTI